MFKRLTYYKKRTIHLKISILLFLPIVSTAQLAFFIKPYFAYSNTSLYNAEDVKGYTTSTYTTLMPMIASYSTSYGADLGVTWQKENVGFSINTGVSYLPFKQKYSGDFFYPNDPGSASAKTTLNYLRVPLHAEVNFLNTHKIVPTIGIGASVFQLVNYTDEFYGILPSVNPGGSQIEQSMVIKNKEYSSNIGIGSVGFLDKWYYNKTIFNSFVSLGADYRINERVSITSKILNTYSFNNPETSENISCNFQNTSGTGGGSFNYNPYKQLIGKIIQRDPTWATRPTTHLIQTGFLIGFKFVL